MVNAREGITGIDYIRHALYIYSPFKAFTICHFLEIGYWARWSDPVCLQEEVGEDLFFFVLSRLLAVKSGSRRGGGEDSRIKTFLEQ